MGLSKETTKLEAEKLFNMYFQMNSKLDTIVYCLQNDFNLTRFADFVHHSLSHLMPLWADNIQEFADLRGDKFHRSALQASVGDYNSPIECMKDAYEYCLELERQLNIGIKTAIQNDDLMYEDFLRDFNFSKQAQLTHQIYKFKVALEDYDEDNIVALFNKDFDSYIIPYFKAKED